ncbi:site-specific integrase [Marinifilum sp. JC120]|nr:site-specific integrase [Marinifilum sp. JC120]
MSVHRRPETGSWLVKYRDEFGKQKTQTFGKTTQGKRNAEAFDLEVKLKKKLGEKINPHHDDMYLDELTQLYIDQKKCEGKAGRWLKDFAFILNYHILPELGTVPVNRLTQKKIVRFMMSRYADNSPTTRNRYMSYLKIIFNFGVDQGYTEQNPLQKWKKAKEKPRQSTLSVDELKLIIKHATQHVAWAIEIAFNLGVRTGESELLSLQWKWVDWENKQVRVFATKTNTWRTIPVTDRFLSKLRKYRKNATTPYLVEYNGRPIKSIRKGFRNACKRAGLPDSIITYDIRHLHATTALNNGADLASVSAILGHASTKMTADQYYHVQKNEKIRAVNLLPQL